MPSPRPDPKNHALEVLRAHGGIIRMSQAIRAGVHRRTLYALRDSGRIEAVSRGLFRLAETDSPVDPDLAIIAARIPAGVVCLTSALVHHGLTTQIPREVHLALPRTARTPTLDHPPLRVFRFGGASMTEGQEVRRIDGVDIRIFNREKTIADCFKFRHAIGLDIAIEALRLYVAAPGLSVERLDRYARLDRIAVVIRPYLEALL